MKQNKGTILRASVDYIKILRRQYENASLVEEKCHMLTEENLALQERVKVSEDRTESKDHRCKYRFQGIGTQMCFTWNSHSTDNDQIECSDSNGERRTFLSFIVVE